ncbi:hypothetical protein BASA83_012208 [Batrachochytrium salamandrivorans]|nr:hypothetical protein BASA83_012208 [Batrachochytrium salamandrivorans]
MSTVFRRLCARKPIESVEKELNSSEYKRQLTAFDLTMLGVGSIIGAGIFVLTGKAARENAGPAIMLSFMISGLVCSLACLCYAELGSTLPVSGSAYSFTYSALGELLAWIVGWDLMLEYVVGSATVSVGWGVYLDIFIAGLMGKSRVFDPRYTSAPLVWHESEDASGRPTGFYFNVVECLDGSQCQTFFNFPAFGIIAAITVLLCCGMQESTRINSVLVAIKLAVCFIFIFAGIKFINPENYTPFIPPAQGHGKYGLSGVFQGSVAIFFSYLGFDAITTTAQETANPQRDLPIGIICSLVICTLMYVGVSAVLTGMVHYTAIDLSAPVSQALIDVGLPSLAIVISGGVICGLGSMIIVALIAQPRIFYSMAKDGLLPQVFARIDGKSGIPYASTIGSGILCALLAGLFPIDLLANLASVGTLTAFFLVSVSTLVLRITEPDLPRAFQIPGGFWIGGMLIPFLSAAFSAALFSQASVSSISRVFIWMGLGLIIYALYGYHHSVVGKQMTKRMTLEEPIMLNVDFKA